MNKEIIIKGDFTIEPMPSNCYKRLKYAKISVNYVPQMKAGVYYRVSTADKQDIGMQQKAIRDYCNREAIEVFKEYSDVGVSGKKESRPEFDRLLNDMRNKCFDCIVVYKLDRIGRSISHLLKLFEEFSKRDIKFISVTQNFNTTTPEGRLFLRMMMLLAEYERELTISRINSGLDRVRAEGRRLGRPSGSKDKKRRRISGYINRWLKGGKYETRKL